MDMLVRELKEELEARDQRSAQDRQQGVAAPEAARRDRARASCRARPRAIKRMYTYLEWALLPFCEMGQTFYHFN